MYYFTKDLADFFAVETMKSGISKTLVGKVLEIANNACITGVINGSLTHKDYIKNLIHNAHSWNNNYTLDLDALEKIARDINELERKANEPR